MAREHYNSLTRAETLVTQTRRHTGAGYIVMPALIFPTDSCHKKATLIPSEVERKARGFAAHAVVRYGCMQRMPLILIRKYRSVFEE